MILPRRLRIFARFGIDAVGSAFVCLLALALFAALTRSGRAADYTWTQSGTSGPYDWTTAGNWASSGQFVSGAANTLVFYADTTTNLSGSGGLTDITTNVPATLTLNALTLNGRGPVSTGTQTVTLGSAASTWTFDGTTPAINLNGVTNGAGKGLAYNVAANLAFNASSTITGNGSATFTLSGSLTGASSVTLTKQGSSALSISGNNPGFNGNWVITAGILNLGGGNSSASTFQVNSGGTLRVSSNTPIGGLTDNAGSGGSITNTSSGGKTITIAGSGTYSFAGNFTTGGANKVGLVISGSGTQILSGSNVVNTGYQSLTGTGGTLVYSTTNSIFQGLAAGAVVNTNNSANAGISVLANNTVALGVGSAASGYFDATAIATFLDGTHMGASTNSTGFRNNSILGFDTTNAGGSFTYSTPLTNIGTSTGIGFAKLGSGTLVLDAANTYGGVTQVRAGTLQLGASGTTGSLASTADITLSPGATLAFNRSDAGLSSSSRITGGGAIAQVGGGSTTLTSTTSDYSGGTTISGGILESRSLGSGAVAISGSGQQLKFGSSTTFANNVSIGAVTGVSGQGVIDTATGVNGVLSGTITVTGAPANGGHFGASSSGSLTINGPINSASATVSQARNRVIYAGGGSYSAFSLNGGSAVLGANNGLSTAAAVAISGTLDLAGYSQSLAGVSRSGAGAATIGNSSTTTDSVLTLTGTSTYSGTIVDAVGSGTRKASLAVNGGSLTLSGTNTYTGNTTVGSGLLSISGAGALQGTSGVNLSNGGRLRYTGGTGTFGKDVTVTPVSGTGTIENAGGGTLTLSGALSKDNSVLRLTGGLFNVTGLITGTTPGASDLVVDAASVTLSNTNTYDGPTFVYNSGTLTLGISNAIPNASVVTLGNGTSAGTLQLAGFTDAISGLAFGAGGGTLRLSATSTSTAPLTATAGTMVLTNGTLDLAGSGSTAGLYRVLAAQSVTGSFASVTGANAAYQVVTTATTVDYQQKSVLGSLTVANPASAIITGGSAAFTYTLSNAAQAGGATLAFSGSGLSGVAGSSIGVAAASASSGPVSGLVFTGTTVGAGQTGTFTVNAPTAYGSTTATGTVSVTVLDHATSSLGASLLTSTTINLGTWNYASQTWESGTNSGLFSIYNLSNNGPGLTAPLSLVSASGTANGFSTNLDTYADIAGGSSGQYRILVDPAQWGTSGLQTATFTLQMSDKADLSGATATNPLTVTANVVIVPEPGTLAAAGAGIVLAVWSIARRRSTRRR